MAAVGRPQQCSNCSCSTARCWCVDCNEALCDDCVLAHRRVTLTRSHRLLNQPQEGPVTGHSLVFPTKFCRLHPAEALRLFCFTCNQLTCRDCQLVAHMNHSFQFVSEALESLKKQLDDCVEPIRAQMTASKKSLDDMELRLKFLNQSEIYVSDRLERCFNMLTKVLKRRMEQIMAEILRVYETERQWISRRKAQVKQLQHNHTLVTETADKAKGINELLPLLAYIAQVTSQVKDLVDQDPSPPPTMVDLKVFTERGDVENISKFGKLEVSWVPFNVFPEGKGSTETPAATSSSSTFTSPTTPCPLANVQLAKTSLPVSNPPSSDPLPRFATGNAAKLCVVASLPQVGHHSTSTVLPSNQSYNYPSSTSHASSLAPPTSTMFAPFSTGVSQTGNYTSSTSHPVLPSVPLATTAPQTYTSVFTALKAHQTGTVTKTGDPTVAKQLYPPAYSTTFTASKGFTPQTGTVITVDNPVVTSRPSPPLDYSSSQLSHRPSSSVPAPKRTTHQPSPADCPPQMEQLPSSQPNLPLCSSSVTPPISSQAGHGSSNGLQPQTATSTLTCPNSDIQINILTKSMLSEISQFCLKWKWKNPKIVKSSSRATKHCPARVRDSSSSSCKLSASSSSNQPFSSQSPAALSSSTTASSSTILSSPPTVLSSSTIASSPTVLSSSTIASSSSPTVLSSSTIASSSSPTVLSSSTIASSSPTVLSSSTIASSSPTVLSSSTIASSPTVLSSSTIASSSSPTVLSSSTIASSSPPTVLSSSTIGSSTKVLSSSCPAISSSSICSTLSSNAILSSSNCSSSTTVPTSSSPALVSTSSICPTYQLVPQNTPSVVQFVNSVSSIQPQVACPSISNTTFKHVQSPLLLNQVVLGQNQPVVMMLTHTQPVYHQFPMLLSNPAVYNGPTFESNCATSLPISLDLQALTQSAPLNYQTMSNRGSYVPGSALTSHQHLSSHSRPCSSSPQDHQQTPELKMVSGSHQSAQQDERQQELGEGEWIPSVEEDQPTTSASGETQSKRLAYEVEEDDPTTSVSEGLAYGLEEDDPTTSVSEETQSKESAYESEEDEPTTSVSEEIKPARQLFSPEMMEEESIIILSEETELSSSDTSDGEPTVVSGESSTLWVKNRRETSNSGTVEGQVSESGWPDISQSRRQPAVSLYRLPVSLRGPGCPLPRFRLIPGDAQDEIYLEQVKEDSQPHVDEESDEITDDDSDVTRDFTVPLSSPESSMSLELLSCVACLSSNASKICSACGRGYHGGCHIPPVGPDIWSEFICSLCQDLSDPSDPYSSDRPESPQSPWLGLQDQRRCEKLLLHLMVEGASHLSEFGFWRDLSLMSERLAGHHSPAYDNSAEFVSDIWDLFKDAPQDERRLNELQRSFQETLLEIFGSDLHPSLLAPAHSNSPSAAGSPSGSQSEGVEEEEKEEEEEEVRRSRDEMSNVEGEAEVKSVPKLSELRKRLRDFLDENTPSTAKRPRKTEELPIIM